MSERFDYFVGYAKELAVAHGIPWELPVDSTGRVAKEVAWNLTELCGEKRPRVHRLNHLGQEEKALKYIKYGPNADSNISVTPSPLPPPWRDLIKAAVVDAIYIRKTSAQHTAHQIARPLRVLSTCSGDIAPSELGLEEVNYAFEIAEAIQPSGHLRRITELVVRQIIDNEGISHRCPLLPPKPWRKQSSGSTNHLLAQSYPKKRQRRHLSDRLGAEKLPETKAFWHLVRIVFTEEPASFMDAVRFSQLRILVMTGFRVGEVCHLPVWTLKPVFHRTFDGSPAENYGGISESKLVRYFSEKQDEARTIDSKLERITFFYPESQPLVREFERPMVDTIRKAKHLTEPLRRRLVQQEQTGRLLPEFSPDALVSIPSLFPYLSGNPFIYDDPKAESLKARYRSSQDIAILEEIESRQEDLEEQGSPIRNDVRVYFARLRRGRESQLPCFLPDGRITKRIDYRRGSFRIADVEAVLRDKMPTKMPDTEVFWTTDEERVCSSEMLFLAPKRALSEERNDGICDIRKYFAVGRVNSEDLISYLGGGNKSSGKATLFSKYGRSGEESRLKLNTHSFRHLYNTELFHLGIADSIITKWFGRKSSDSNEAYDHRTLGEHLEEIEPPEDVEDFMPYRAQKLLGMIERGAVSGTFVDEFKNIQKESGDQAAFEFLSVEADGFHSTPYGYCINSFTVEACPHHLECFKGCRNLARSDRPEEEKNLLTLFDQLDRAVELAEAKPSDSIGRDNQIEHARIRRDNVKKMLETPLGENPFPDGPDLSDPVDSNDDSILG